MNKARRRMLLAGGLIIVIIAVSLGAIYLTTITNITASAVWKDSTGSQVSSDLLLSGRTYSVAVTASPSVFIDENNKFWLIGEMKIDVTNATTGTLVSTYSWTIPADSIYGTYVGGVASATINVTTPSAPGQYKAALFVKYYLCTVTPGPSSISPSIITISWYTPNSAGWIQGLTQTITTQTQTWVWKRADGTTISDITTATISGTITCEVNFGITTFQDTTGTWVLSKVFVNVYPKSDGSYSATLAKQYLGYLTGSATKYLITVDTTQIPNGNYKFILGTIWVSGSQNRTFSLSVFYASFGGGGGGGGVPQEPTSQLPLIILAALGIFVLAVIVAKRRKIIA